MKSYIKKAKEVFGMEKFYPDRPNNDIYGPAGRGR
jgi:hypothetical protein